MAYRTLGQRTHSSQVATGRLEGGAIPGGPGGVGTLDTRQGGLSWGWDTYPPPAPSPGARPYHMSQPLRHSRALSWSHGHHSGSVFSCNWPLGRQSPGLFPDVPQTPQHQCCCGRVTGQAAKHLTQAVLLLCAWVCDLRPRPRVADPGAGHQASANSALRAEKGGPAAPATVVLHLVRSHRRSSVGRLVSFLICGDSLYSPNVGPCVHPADASC